MKGKEAAVAGAEWPGVSSRRALGPELGFGPYSKCDRQPLVRTGEGTAEGAKGMACAGINKVAVEKGL